MAGMRGVGGVRLIGFFVIDLNFLWLAAILVALWLGYQNHSAGFPGPFPLTTGLMTAAYMAYLVCLGYHVSMDDAFRYYVPLIPLLTILMVESFPRGALHDGNLFRPPIMAFLCVLVAVRLFDPGYMWYRDMNLGLFRYCAGGKVCADGLRSGHVSAGLWLRKHAQVGDTIMLHDIGAIPYFSRLYAIDTWSLADRRVIEFKRQMSRGLNDEEKRKAAESIKQYLIGKKPTFIVQDEYGLMEDQRIKNAYVRVGPDFVFMDPEFVKDSICPFVPWKKMPGYIIRIYRRVQ